MVKNEIKNKKLCFLSLGSDRLLENIKKKTTGGAELQQIKYAEALSKKNYDVSLITYKNKKNDQLNSKLNYYYVYNRQKLKRYPSILKYYLIWKKLKSINADVYLYRAGSPSIVSLFSIIHNKKSVKFLASDSEINNEIIENKNFIDSLFFRIATKFDLYFSDLVISQSKKQSTLLKQNKWINSPIITNIIENQDEKANNRKKKHILWVGKINSNKNPLLFIDIAKKFPINNFLMIGKVQNKSLFNKMEKELRKVKNCQFLGPIHHNSLREYYIDAFFLINTSKTEGFPNVFLEAWQYSIPVVSLNVDPDGVISKYKLGFYSKNRNNLIKDVQKLIIDKDLRINLGKNGKRYILLYHDINKNSMKLMKYINNLD